MTIIGSLAQTLMNAVPPRLPTMGTRFGGQTSFFGGIQKEAQIRSSLSAYGQVGWLFSMVNREAEAVADIDWHLYQGKSIHERKEILQDPMLALWNKPNEFTDREELVEAWMQHYILVGEMWGWVSRLPNGNPGEIWTIRPDLIAPVRDREQYLLGYAYSVDGEVVPLRKEDVLYRRRRDPLDPYRGVGLVQTIIADLEGEKAAALWNRNFFFNSAEPNGVIEFEKPLTKVQFDEFLSEWEAQHKGVANSHRVAILSRGKWVDRKYTQRDMQFGDLRRMNRDVILGARGFPKSVLGVTDDVNRANAEAALEMFARLITKPDLTKIRGMLNARYVPMWRGTAGKTFDYEDPVPENRELNLEIADRGYRSRLLSQNEGRRLLGHGDVPGGEQFLPAPVSRNTPSVAGDDAPAQRNLLLPGQQNGHVESDHACPVCATRLPVAYLEGEAGVYCRKCREVVSLVG